LPAERSPALSLYGKPQIQVTREKFAAIIHTNNSGLTDLMAYPVQGVYDIFNTITEASNNCWGET
jgi:hypothetical protein